ncbi:MAG TPA: HAMP domain-containing histidine kinase [Nannocystis exedens]|nr:HAMP domain-containing histidine kinase [Nannocystis exedens]
MHNHLETSLAEIAPFVASAGVDLRYNEAPEIGEMKSDAERLQLMIVNIIRHFVAISREGATLVLGVARRQRAEGEALIIEIRNRDLFLSKTQVKHFFEPFAWLEARNEGVGGEIRLGLILARRICELLGGTFVARVDDGSALEIALPIEPRQDADNVIYPEKECMEPEAG